MSNNTGFSVRIYMPTGEPEGIRVVEKSMWTGQGVIFPRSLFSEARERDELKRTGVYILWGPNDEGGLPEVYVGEGEPVLPRLEMHVRSKDFWTQAVVFSSKDQNLNKAHVQYLEARLVELASAAKRCDLKNGNVPKPSSLSEADTADAESYLSDLLLCLPLFGVTYFEKPNVTRLTKNPKLYLEARGVEAAGMENLEGFLVFEGSQAAKKRTPSLHEYLEEIRQALIEKGVFEDAGKHYRVTQDYVFHSPSQSASVLLGRNTNGRVYWHDKTGRILRDIQEAEAGKP